jgi:hypothetical protein
MENAVFDSVEKWAVRFAEGYVDGRSPMEEQVRIDDFVSRLSFPNYTERELPQLRASEPHSPSLGTTVSAGPFRDLFSVKIPNALSDLLGIPRDTGQPQVAQVLSIKSREPLIVHRIPTCTDKDIFKALKSGEHPPHPVLEFLRPLDRVHVRLVNEQDKILWDASYNLKGGRILNNSIAEAIPGESKVPDYIPPCAISRANLQLRVDAEEKAPIRIDFFNPNNPGEAARYREDLLRSRPPESNVPQQEVERADSLICKVKKAYPSLEKLIDTAGKTSQVYIPPSLESQLWRFDKTREESSSLNPHGMPMKDLTGPRASAGPVVDPGLSTMAPMAIGSGKNAVHLIPRKHPLGGEIQVDQLERSTFHVFDSRNMPKDIRQVDKSAILHTPKGFHQPTVQRTVYSPMWQGIHGVDPQQPLTQKFAHLKTNIHPSFQFKHPATVAHVQFTDLTSKKSLWDAFFDVRGNHKIAADQVPVGGKKPEFEGIDPHTGKTHFYSLRIDVDNPADRIQGSTDRLVDFWRYSDFLFGATRPFSHGDVNIQVTNTGAPAVIPMPAVRA